MKKATLNHLARSISSKLTPAHCEKQKKKNCERRGNYNLAKDGGEKLKQGQGERARKLAPRLTFPLTFQ